MHVIWYTAMTMDARIAGPDDALDFLETVDGAGEEDDFPSFVASVDALVVGSTTLRWLHGQGHELPNRGLPIWLVSHDGELAARAAAVDPDGTPVEHVQGDMGEILGRIEAAGHERVWICGGGDVAGQVAALDRLD